MLRVLSKTCYKELLLIKVPATSEDHSPLCYESQETRQVLHSVWGWLYTFHSKEVSSNDQRRSTRLAATPLSCHIKKKLSLRASQRRTFLRAYLIYNSVYKIHEQILFITNYELRSSLQLHVGSFEDIWFHKETAFTSLQYIKARVVQVSPFAPGVQLLPFCISLLVLARRWSSGYSLE